MANTIILKRSATPGKVPTTSQLALGEIAINTYDGLIYIKKDDGTPSIAQIGGVTSVNSKTGTAVLNSDDISDSGRTNKWFSNTLARGAISAGTGISYNSSTGVISTAQSITTSASPTFAGLTLTGNMGITGNIIPSADVTYNLGSADYQWKDIYVGPGSLYVNGQKVLQDDTGTITFSADVDQNIRVKTLGTGILQLGSTSTTVQVDGTLQLTSGKRITDSAGTNVQFGNPIHMNSNKITNLGTPSANTDAATKGYVDTTVAAISTSSITQGNSNVTVTDTGTGSVTVSVDGSTALTVTSSGVVVAGNFTVQGTTTTVESNTIALADNIITLNSDATGTPTQNAGIEVERGDEANVQVRWNEGSTKWTFTNDGATYNPIAASTTDLAEGTNQYFTTTRARNSISATSATGVSYNSTTGAISLGSIPNSSLTNNSITINGTSVALGGTRTLDTDAVSEGSTNVYFTNTRARGAVSATAGTGLSYNSSTGAFSLASIPNSSLTNTTVTIGTTGIALGATSTTLAGLTSVTSTAFTGALSGNATTATTLQNARTINGVSFDGSANVTVHTAGTGISVSGATVSIDTATTVDKTTAQTLTNKSLSDSTTFIIDETDGTKKLQFQVGNITTGTTRTLTAPDVSGTIITTGDTGTVTNTMLAGSIANSKLTNSSVTVGTTAISLGSSSTTLAGLTSVTSTGFTGALTGNASTASAWANARTITLGGDLSGSVSIDGSANVTLTATIAADSIALGTDTTGNYVATVTAGSGITVSGSGSETAAVTVSIDSTVATLTGTQTLTNKTLTSPTVSAPTVSGITTVKTGSTAVTDEYVVYFNASTNAGNQVVDSIAIASYTSVEYLISVETSTDKEVWAETLTYNSSNAVYQGEQLKVATSATLLASFDADISSGNLRLLVTPTNANTKFKVKAIAYKV